MLKNFEKNSSMLTRRIKTCYTYERTEREKDVYIKEENGIKREMLLWYRIEGLVFCTAMVNQQFGRSKFSVGASQEW